MRPHRWPGPGGVRGPRRRLASPTLLGLCALLRTRSPSSAPRPAPRSARRVAELRAAGRPSHGQTCFLGVHARGRSGRKTAVDADFSSQAAGLFTNMRTPAAFIAGSLLTLGFKSSPRVSTDDGPVMRRVKFAHFLFATLAICCELQSIMWATIAANKLTEASHAPAVGVMQLLDRDYELEWIGCNVTFMIGLIGLSACLSTFALISFGGARRLALCFMAASMSMMLSIINTGISKGDGKGFGFGGNLFDLVVRYHRLLLARAVGGHGFFCIVSLSLYVGTAALGVWELYRMVDETVEVLSPRMGRRSHANLRP